MSIEVKPKVRAKFRCNSVTTSDHGNGHKGASVILTPVYSTDPNSENKRFWDATPNGKLEMHSTPERLVMFEPGKDYYLDFTLAD